MPCSVPKGLSCLSKGLQSRCSGHRDFTPSSSIPFTSGIISASFGCQSTTLSSLDVQAMLPENLSHFYRYQGSLTTPPCSESVIWTVFHSPIVLSHTQVSGALGSSSSLPAFPSVSCRDSGAAAEPSGLPQALGGALGGAGAGDVMIT